MSKCVYDPETTNLEIIKESFYYLLGFYRGMKEDIHPNTPKPFGREIQVTLYVDAEHEGILISLQ